MLQFDCNDHVVKYDITVLFLDSQICKKKQLKLRINSLIKSPETVL